ncbi:hypothetical protein HMPREF2905_08545 [Staphylococcus sp. HMSC078E07]|nr:hypothetical protein HMPREF2905_08545 [Staphylococcus sp. HMSC078E07]
MLLIVVIGAKAGVKKISTTTNGSVTLLHIQRILDLVDALNIIRVDDSVIIANKDFITLINTAGLEQYITKVPETVKSIEACKLYDSRNLKDNVEGKLKKMIY